MISELHETIVDEIRFSFSLFMREFGYTLRDNVGGVVEASLANLLTGLVGIGLMADAYIFSNAGYGVIPVEVGNMKAGKWSGVTTTDDKPVRCLASILIERSGYSKGETRSLKANYCNFTPQDLRNFPTRSRYSHNDFSSKDGVGWLQKGREPQDSLRAHGFSAAEFSAILNVFSVEPFRSRPELRIAFSQKV